MKRLYLLLAAQVTAVCLLITGCTTVKNPDGSTSRVLGFDSPEAQAKAQQTVESGAALLPWPFNAIVTTVGGLAITLIGAYAAKKKGEDIGWDTAHSESPALGGAPAKSTAPPAPPAP